MLSKRVSPFIQNNVATTGIVFKSRPTAWQWELECKCQNTAGRDLVESLRIFSSLFFALVSQQYRGLL